MADWQKFTFSSRFGAYGDWLLDPGAAYDIEYEFDADGNFPVLIDTGTDAGSSALLNAFGGSSSSGSADTGKGSLVTGAGPKPATEGLLSAVADKKALTRLAREQSLASHFNRIIVSQKLPEDAYCKCTSRSGQQGSRGASGNPAATNGPNGAVVVGIVDEGIAFANERFRNADAQTRVENFWMQDGKCRGQGTCTVDYGREFTRDEINQQLNEFLENGNLNEDRFYSKIGLIDFTRAGHKSAAFQASHGTHVLDIASGYPRGETTNSDGIETRPLVCVQLPTRTVADTSGIGLEKYLIDGIIYILDRAEKLARERNCTALPVVINFSSAIFAGPHDGNHHIELKINELLADYATRNSTQARLVVPAGNHFLSGTHIRTELKAHGTANEENKTTLNWQVQPDDKTFSFVEFWLPPHEEGSPPKTFIRVTPPGGEKSIKLDNSANDKGIKWKPASHDGNILCKVYHESFPSTPTGPGSAAGKRSRFVVAIAPTAIKDKIVPLAPHGEWKIHFVNKSATGQVMHGWIQWDGNPITYPITGRQSYFVDRAAQAYDRITGRIIESDSEDSVVKRYGTISALATSSHFVTVGGITFHDVSCTQYSAAGEIGNSPEIPGPDISAVTDDSYIHFGILGAGSRSGSVIAVNGTSVAAPQITRKIADLLSANPAENIDAAITQLATDGESAITSGNLPHGKPVDQNPERPAPDAARIGRGRAVTIYPLASHKSQSLRQNTR